MRSILLSLSAVLLLGCNSTNEKILPIVANCEISSDLKFIRVKDDSGETSQYYSINDKVLLPIPGHVSGRYKPISKTFSLSRREFICQG